MARLNERARATRKTHEGGTASHQTALETLERTVSCCLLWENSFYEDGESVAERIAKLVPEVDPFSVAGLAVKARQELKLRHVPLLIVREMARHREHKSLVATTLSQVIQRPDELTEFLAIYWKDGREPLSAQVKKGLARAFKKFNAYSLAKYNRDNAIKLRDVLFLCHAKAENEEQDKLWKALIDGTLESPDTWEVELSKGRSKHGSWTRLLEENKLGALALLRNLRNMREANVNQNLIKRALADLSVERVLPYRFIAAAEHAPEMEPELEKKMFEALETAERLRGHTGLLIDVSGSMTWSLAGRSKMNRLDAACGLAILLREVCDEISVFTFSNSFDQIPARRGFALRDAIKKMPNGGTYLGGALKRLEEVGKYDRVIVITDEQSHDNVHASKIAERNYMLNVATYENGVGFGPWTRVNGWSESVVRFIVDQEQ